MTALILAAILAAAPQTSTRSVEPMLDGSCDDHEGGDSRFQPGANVRAFVHQTRDHVWLCFAVPEGSFATLDVRIEAPALREPLNLHASAQLGEWPADDRSAAPAGPDSPLWWKIRGWRANTTPFNGTVRTAGNLQVRFRPVIGREVQLSKSRFGKGQWRISATLSDIARPEGGSAEVRWPQEGSARVEVR